jgi:hypothetical protein
VALKRSVNNQFCAGRKTRLSKQPKETVMKYWSKITIGSVILLFGHSHAGFAVPVLEDDHSVSCGLDDVCHDECGHDPDCPGVLDPPPEDTDSPVTEVVLTGQPSLTGVSGIAGSRYTRGNANSTNTAVFAILSNERSNHPCYVAVGTENVNNAALDTLPVPEVDLCGTNGATSSTLHADYLDTNAGGGDDRVFVSGVRVCMNNGNDRVKGIRVAGKRITTSGSLVTFGEVVDTRTNCDHWESWVDCPTGQIATAVDLHFDAAGNLPRSLTGIALQCRAVTQ